jgi:hypothetical protein
VVKSPIMLRMEQEASILSEMKRSDGTKLLANVGFPQREYQDSDLPYAAHETTAYPSIYHNIIICHVANPTQDEEKIFQFLTDLASSPFISWIGRTKYELRDGRIYGIVPCQVQAEEELKQKLI